MKQVACFIALSILFFHTHIANAQLLKVGIAGLNHDHAYGIMQQHKNGEVIILGIAEPDKQLAERYKKQWQLPDSIFYTSVAEMLQHITRCSACIQCHCRSSCCCGSLCTKTYFCNG